ncbi:TPA: DNA translocase FtsK [Candidatus Dojkabacteria bacterium]|uniref:DNA translocase FtsK n=1 Tax=Candidatus Dojkabacteria bacterium TaxID=2099670 RepID=A0A832QHT5_9BACT|nr:DNA translocase FtsK [Candidatus Dojkabacteria bacterium]
MIFTYMATKKKKEKLTIKSSETKILFGTILFVGGIAVLISPFIQDQATLFAKVSLLLGYGAIPWGILLIYTSFFLLFKNKKFVSAKQAVGILFFSLCISILLSFWQNPEQYTNPDALRGAGGELGKLLHTSLNGVLGNLIEILVVIIFLILAFSLITGTTIEQIRDFIEGSIPEPQKEDLTEKPSVLQSVLERLRISKKEDDIKISGEAVSDVPEEPEMEETVDIEKKIDEILHREKKNEEDIELEGEVVKDTKDEQPQQPKYTDWVFPDISLLQEKEVHKQDAKLYKEKALIIQRTLMNFGIQAKVVSIAVGPTVLRFSLSISTGTKVSRVKSLSNDLALALASQTASIRIEAPIPGTPYVGIEVPNPTPNFVYTRDMIKKLRPEVDKYELPLILGKDITGKTMITDLGKIPHLLVAGATGTGKSVAINSLLTGLLMTKTPDEVKFILVDPKMGVEMGMYNGIPHLLTPVITDSALVTNALEWTIGEMMKRYTQLKQVHAKKLAEYNAKMGYVAMPYIVVVIDEMADLMLTSGIEVETKIQRLAQMGRAVGIHLILATQKPTVDVITGLIKSNIPGRMAFAVSTLMDSRVILDEAGAETLLGSGDMLYKDQTTPKPIRIQGTYTSTGDTESIVNAIKEQVKDSEPEYSTALTDAIEKGTDGGALGSENERDPDFEKALEVVVLTQKASASFLQRKMKIGYNKAARLIDQLYDAGAIGPQDGSKPRKVLVEDVSEILGGDVEDEY